MSSDGARLLGRAFVRCTLSMTTFICDATAVVFGKGKIAASGAIFILYPSSTTSPSGWPITEGTRWYRGTGGDVHVVDNPDGCTTLVFRLTD